MIKIDPPVTITPIFFPFYLWCGHSSCSRFSIFIEISNPNTQPSNIVTIARAIPLLWCPYCGISGNVETTFFAGEDPEQLYRRLALAVAFAEEL